MAEYPDLDGRDPAGARRVEWYAPDRPVNGTTFVRPADDDERPDLDGRDPATLTDLEKLAYAYPEVAELVRERDALRDEMEDRTSEYVHLLQQVLLVAEQWRRPINLDVRAMPAGYLLCCELDELAERV
jgi:hypothetical protein